MAPALSSTPYYWQIAGMWDRRAAGISVTAQCEANDGEKKKKKKHNSSSSVDTICNNNKPALEALEGNTVAGRAHVMGMHSIVQVVVLLY